MRRAGTYFDMHEDNTERLL